MVDYLQREELEERFRLYAQQKKEHPYRRVNVRFVQEFDNNQDFGPISGITRWMRLLSSVRKITDPSYFVHVHMSLLACNKEFAYMTLQPGRKGNYDTAMSSTTAAAARKPPPPPPPPPLVIKRTHDNDDNNDTAKPKAKAKRPPPASSLPLIERMNARHKREIEQKKKKKQLEQKKKMMEEREKERNSSETVVNQQ